MIRFGYTLMTEQSGARDLVRYAVAAEKGGFDFEVASDRYSPWLASQGHSPYAWSVLGAVAHATERVGPAFIDAGYTDIALVQVGDDSQDQVLAEAADPLLEQLRALA